MRMPAVTPRVSVVIPTYNRVEYLREAIASVFSQTYPHWELVIVDDGSTDGTAHFLAAMEDPRLRVIRRTHLGLPAVTRNLGIAHATGTYVAFLDSDDVWADTKLASQVDHLLANPDCRWAYTRFGMIDRDGEEIPIPSGGPWKSRSGNILPQLITTEVAAAISTVMCERSLVLEVDGFDEAIPYPEDYDLCLRLAARAPVVAVDETLCWIREHGTRRTAVEPIRDNAHDCVARVYLKFERGVTDADIRHLCRRRLAFHLIESANQHLISGSAPAARAKLARAFRYGLFDARWWMVGAKYALTPIRRIAWRRPA